MKPRWSRSIPLAVVSASTLTASAARADEPTAPPETTPDAQPEAGPGTPLWAPPVPAPAARPIPATDDLERLLDQEGRDGALGGWGDDRRAERRRTFPWVEHHGYFRFRADYFSNGHLGTVVPGVAGSGTSGLPAPLSENAANNSDPDVAQLVGSTGASTLASANMRLRYQPTLHLSDAMRVKTTLDLLDNIVMGSTPDYAGHLGRPDVPLSAFVQSQSPPSDRTNGFRDSVRVKEAYGEFQPAFLIRAGRQAWDWGLGLLANSGNNVNRGVGPGAGLDQDFGDFADRLLVAARVWDVSVAFAWDYLYSGAISDDPALAYGQPIDMGEDDDANQYIISIFQRPVTAEEKEQRRVELTEQFKPALDWGLFGVYREQAFDLSNASYADWREEGGVDSYDSLELTRRDAWAFIPDLWLRYEQHFDFSTSLRVELEAIAIVGEIGDVSAVATPANVQNSREIEQYGAALEVELNVDQLRTGLDAGFATGDDAEGFGVLDRHQIASADGSPNRQLTAFKFDRDYYIDLILFREVIGTVTNAVYLKPYVAYDFFESPEDTLGVRLDLLYAEALEPVATPGNDGFLGLEADLRLFYHTQSGFRFDLESGLLLPGGAFNYRPADPANNRDAELAFTLQSRLTAKF